MKIPRPITVLGAVLLVVAAFFAGNEFRLWRNTIFHSIAGGTIELPSGHRLPKNQWIVFPSDIPEIGFLQELGNLLPCRGGYWRNLERAAETMELRDRIPHLRQRFEQAGNRE